MCATFQFRGKTYKPGSEVAGSGERGIICHAWAGFARSEILSWWKKRGAVLIDIPADRFAERSEVTRKLIWDEVAEGFVIRGWWTSRPPSRSSKSSPAPQARRNSTAFSIRACRCWRCPGLRLCRRGW